MYPASSGTTEITPKHEFYSHKIMWSHGIQNVKTIAIFEAEQN